MCTSIQLSKLIIHAILVLAVTLLLAAIPAPRAETYSTTATISVTPNPAGLLQDTQALSRNAFLVFVC